VPAQSRCRPAAASTTTPRSAGVTAQGRRDGSFPELVDRTSRISAPLSFDDGDDALAWVAENFRVDRTRTPPWQIWLDVEKDTVADLVEPWVEERGIPIITARGFASQSFKDHVVRIVEHDDRKSVLLHVGDFDPSGEDTHDPDPGSGRSSHGAGRMEPSASNAEVNG
jgi:hypothetical protein